MLLPWGEKGWLSGKDAALGLGDLGAVPSCATYSVTLSRMFPGKMCLTFVGGAVWVGCCSWGSPESGTPPLKLPSLGVECGGASHVGSMPGMQTVSV